MDEIRKAHERLEGRDNLARSVDEVQGIIDQLKRARSGLAEDSQNAAATFAKLHGPVKKSFETVGEQLKGIYSAQGKYSKAIDKKFREKALPFENSDALSSHPSLINRAIAMHLLREGHFDVAASFIQEANDRPPSAQGPAQSSAQSPARSPARRAWEMDFSPSASMSTALHGQFQDMYAILNELRARHNLQPAIEWARRHSRVLDARGSNLEYDLCRLQYMALLAARGPVAAMRYAHDTFGRFHRRYEAQTLRLCGALAFMPNLAASPYRAEFAATSEANTYSIAAAAFTAEFCALLQLSSASPLLTAVTAGCIALPTLLKLSHIQQTRRTSWTTESELPVEVPLPPGYQFHSIFVCPVSKEQSTDSNPPMMLPCGHVVAKDSMGQLSRGTRFKCPYCPIESHPKDALKIYF